MEHNWLDLAIDKKLKSFVIFNRFNTKTENYNEMTKMKKILAILASVMATASLVEASELSVSGTFAWESEYIFRGVRLADEYFAPSIDVSYGDFYAGIWAALPVEGTKWDGTDQNEVDYYAGYGLGLSETISADFGFTYYTYPEAEEDFFGDPNTFEIYGGLSFDVPFSPAVYVFYDFDLDALTLEVSGGHTVELTEESAVDFSIYLGNVAPDEGSDYVYYGAGVSYSYSLTENASVSIGVNYYGADEAMEADGSKSKFTWGCSFSAGF